MEHPDGSGIILYQDKKKQEDYKTDDSREMLGRFIQWAKEFEYLHKHIQWGINSPVDYIDSTYYFTLFKIN